MLDRAGGLTPQAYANGIRFFRREAGAGRVGLELVKVLKNQRDKDNIVLTDGDSLYIPSYVPTVRVEGAVNSPGSVTYVRGQGLDYYLSAAGGVSFKGDKKRIFVQQPNGNVRAVHKRPLFFGTSKPAPEPGALVVVPVRDTTAQSQTGTIIAGVAQIIAALTSELDGYKRSARSAHEEATSEQSKAENKYDTRGLEAAYLAGAQSRQAAEA